jgi:glycosyltransferase involved in cell wall biosynthesis
LALLDEGINSFFLSSDNDTEIECCIKLTQLNNSFINTFVDKIKWRLKNHFKIIIDKRERFTDQLNRMIPDLKCEMATLPFSNFDLLKHPSVQNADIIHLHWVAGMLDYPSFFKHNTKPVVWTLHDMNPFQGIFHYNEDEIRNQAISSRFNAKVLRIKQRAIKSSKHTITVVCPSQWLLAKAMQSNLFKRSTGYCIANPLDMDIFYPVEKEQVRKAMNIPAGNRIFLFVSQSVKNHRKGFDLLIGALAKIKDQPVTLLVIGENESIHIPGLDIKMTGTIDDHEKLRDCYSVADAFIIPSREDNLPNVMLEAMACGTPVLSFNVGGMATMIQDGFNGLKAPEVSTDSLAKILVDFIGMKDQFNSEKIRKFALDIFSNGAIASRYIELYKKV